MQIPAERFRCKEISSDYQLIRERERRELRERALANKELLFAKRLLITPPGSSARLSNFPRPLYSFRRGTVSKLQPETLSLSLSFSSVLNYLLQKRQGGPSRTKGRSRVSYRVERIEDSRKQSTTLYLLLRAYTAVYFAERNSARCNFNGKTVEIPSRCTPFSSL